MKTTNYIVRRYDADPGKVFDYKEPRYIEDAEGNQVQEHLYASSLFMGDSDSIENYIEVDAQEAVEDET